METARVDIRKLQLLNDRIAQCLEALAQVRLSVHGLSQTQGAGMGPMLGTQPQQQLGGFQGQDPRFQTAQDPRFTQQQTPQYGGFGAFTPPMTPYHGGLSHTGPGQQLGPQLPPWQQQNPFGQQQPPFGQQQPPFGQQQPPFGQQQSPFTQQIPFGPQLGQQSPFTQQIPFGQQPFGQQQLGQQPFGPQQFGQQPFGPQQFGQQPFGPQQFGQQPSGPQQFGQQPYSQQQLGQQPFGQQQSPFGQQPMQQYGQTPPYQQQSPFGAQPQNPTQGNPLAAWSGMSGLSHTGDDEALYSRPLWADPLLQSRVRETFPYAGYALSPFVSLF